MLNRLLHHSFLFLFLSLSGCGGLNSGTPPFSDSDGLPTEKQPSDASITCTVHLSKPLGKVPRGLFGTNLEWFNNANGIMPSSGIFNSKLVQLAEDQGITSVRFPGGTFSDYYHWRDGIGLAKDRPVRPHFTDSGKSPNVMGTNELMRFCKLIGADPMLTVNAGTGTAQEAADWVAYCNSPTHPDRKEKAYDVKVWEVGNELYLPDNPGPKITIEPSVYADKFLDYSKAMRKTDPSIRLMAIGTANASRFPEHYKDWTKIVLQKAASEIDFISVHNGYFPVFFEPKGFSLKEAYQTLWAAPESVDHTMSELEALIKKHEKQRKIEIAVTEWGPFFSFEENWMTHNKTMGSAVYVARMFQVYLNQPRVTMAHYFKFTDNSFMGWVSYKAVPKVPYYVVQLFSKHFGSQLLTCHVEGSPTFNSKALGIARSESNVPEITAVASTHSSGKKVYLNLINRSWDNYHKVQIKIPGFSYNPQNVKAWSLSSPGVTDHNGPDLPSYFPIKAREPYQSPESQGKHIKLEQKTLDISEGVTLHPFSVITLELNSN